MFLLSHLDAVITVLTIAAGSAVGIREWVLERRRRRDESAATVGPTLAGIPLSVGTARVEQVGDDYRLDLTFNLATPAIEATATDGDLFPTNVTVLSISRQAFAPTRAFARPGAPDQPQQTRTTGDEYAGFFQLDKPETAGYPTGARVEVYRWGRLAAGAVLRGMWLLLLPFSLANVAMWLCPEERVRRYIVQLLCRLFALALTITTVLAMIAVALDLGAWQCVHRRSCDAGLPAPPLLGDDLGHLLAAMALVPVGAIVLGWVLARRTWKIYESHHEPLPDDTPASGAAPDFLRGGRTVRRLRGLHITAAFATVNLVLIGAVTWNNHVRPPFATPLALASTAALAVTVIAIALPPMIDDSRRHQVPERVIATVRSLTILLTAVTLWWTWWHPPGADLREESSLPYLQTTVTVVFMAQICLCLLMTLAVVTVRGGRLKFSWLGVPIFATLSLGPAAALLAGLVYRVAGALSNNQVALQDKGSHSPLPAAPYEWAGAGFAAMLSLAAIASFFVIRPRRSKRADAQRLTREDFGEEGRFHPTNVRRVDQAIAAAGIVERTLRVLGWMCVPLALLAAATSVLALEGIYPPPVIRSAWLTASTVGFTLLGITALAALWLLVIARRRGGIRNALGFLWEINTFWPRTCHPLGPPCYAARTVPELALRAAELLRNPEARVLLVGHGQGSVLAFAALQHLTDRERDRVGLITTGSPLGLLYPSIFDEHFDHKIYAAYADMLSTGGHAPRWLNLWRRTDPVSGAIPRTPDRESAEHDPMNRRLKDPESVTIRPGDKGSYSPIRGHADYHADRRFADAVSELARRLITEPLPDGARHAVELEAALSAS